MANISIIWAGISHSLPFSFYSCLISKILFWKMKNILAFSLYLHVRKWWLCVLFVRLLCNLDGLWKMIKSKHITSKEWHCTQYSPAASVSLCSPLSLSCWRPAPAGEAASRCWISAAWRLDTCSQSEVAIRSCDPAPTNHSSPADCRGSCGPSASPPSPRGLQTRGSPPPGE